MGLRSTEEMDVIGHDYILTYQPFISFQPRLDQRGVDVIVSQSDLPLRSTDSKKGYCGIVPIAVNTGGRVAASTGVIRRLDRVSPHRF